MNYRGLKALRAFAFGVVLSGLVIGCESGVVNQEVAVNQQNAATKQTATKQFTSVQIQEMSVANRQLEAMSIAVAKTLTNDDMRKWVYEKCLERFDGETNVLWKQLESDRSHTWAKRISASLPASNNNFSVEAATAKIQGKMGANLHLFWYNAEKWDKKSEPIVVYTPVDKDPQKMPYLTGYDAQGRSYQVDEAFAKAHTVIVLTFNERTNLSGDLLSNLRQSNRKSSSSLQASSSVNIKELIFKQSMNWYEGWFDGQAEFRAISRDPGGSTDLDAQDFYVYRSTIDNDPKKLEVNRNIIASQVGPNTQVRWIEMDIAVGEWGWGGADDELGVFQVSPTGTTTYESSDFGAKFFWE